MTERMEGLQGWMAEIEKKQERMTRVGGIAAAVAVLAAGGALALGFMNQQDAASKDDLDELKTTVEGFQNEVKATTEEQLSQNEQRLSSLESQITSIQTQQGQLRKQLNQVQSQPQVIPGAGAGTGTPAPVTPDADAQP
jgi:TolA-binding protein